MQRRRFKQTLYSPEHLDQAERLLTEAEGLMTIGELFELHEFIHDVLSEKLKARMADVERRSRTFHQPSSDGGTIESSRSIN